MNDPMLDYGNLGKRIFKESLFKILKQQEASHEIYKRKGILLEDYYKKKLDKIIISIQKGRKVNSKISRGILGKEKDFLH